MPSLRWTGTAQADLDKVYSFLAVRNPQAARRVLRTIREGVRILRTYPEVGHALRGPMSAYREWVVQFGRGSYVVRYFYDGKTVTITDVRHGREESF